MDSTTGGEMKNLILKMVTKGVMSSDNANRLINMKRDIDPVLKGLNKGFIDEKRLAKFYEQEGYPVIYEEGNNPIGQDNFSRFFTPDVIMKYLVFPISVKKESKDIIIGFLNSANLDAVKQVIQKVFPDFNTTYFHVPYTIFRKVVYKGFMFDMRKYSALTAGKDAAGKVAADIKGNKGSVYQHFLQMAEQAFLFTVENGSIVYKDETMTSRFPIASLPTIKEGLVAGFLDVDSDVISKKLSHTEKIMLFTNMGIKREDKIVMVSKGVENFFFFLINPKASRKELEGVINA